MIEEYIDDFADDELDSGAELGLPGASGTGAQPAKRASAWRSVEEYWEHKRLCRALAELDDYED